MERAVTAAFSWSGRWPHYQLLKDRHRMQKAKDRTATTVGNGRAEWVGGGVRARQSMVVTPADPAVCFTCLRSTFTQFPLQTVSHPCEPSSSCPWEGVVSDSERVSVGLRGLLSLPRRDEGPEVQGGDAADAGPHPQTPGLPSLPVIFS